MHDPRSIFFGTVLVTWLLMVGFSSATDRREYIAFPLLMGVFVIGVMKLMELI